MILELRESFLNREFGHISYYENYIEYPENIPFNQIQHQKIRFSRLQICRENEPNCYWRYHRRGQNNKAPTSDHPKLNFRRELIQVDFICHCMQAVSKLPEDVIRIIMRYIFSIRPLVNKWRAYHDMPGLDKVRMPVRLRLFDLQMEERWKKSDGQI